MKTFSFDFKRNAIIFLAFLAILMNSCSKNPHIVKTYDVTKAEQSDDGLVILVRHYEMSDGTWKTDSASYEYRLEVSGRLNGAAKDSTFVFVSNIKNISFQKAFLAAGFSSNTNDYFSEEEAKFVALK